MLDRTSGEFLLAKPFVKKLTWASGIGTDGRPVPLPANKTDRKGVKTCPAVRGATNWYSTAFNPATGLYYVMTVEDCGIYRKARDGGFGRFVDPADPAMKYLHALDIQTGAVAWEIPLEGPTEANYSGVMSTAGGVIFYGESSGGLAAADAKTGRGLWHFEANQPWKASPMTYTVRAASTWRLLPGPTFSLLRYRKVTPPLSRLRLLDRDCGNNASRGRAVDAADAHRDQ